MEFYKNRSLESHQYPWLVDKTELKNTKVAIERRNISNPNTTAPILRSLEDPASLVIHYRRDEGVRPIFERNDVVVNAQKDEKNPEPASPRSRSANKRNKKCHRSPRSPTKRSKRSPPHHHSRSPAPRCGASATGRTRSRSPKDRGPPERRRSRSPLSRRSNRGRSRSYSLERRSRYSRSPRRSERRYESSRRRRRSPRSRSPRRYTQSGTYDPTRMSYPYFAGAEFGFPNPMFPLQPAFIPGHMLPYGAFPPRIPPVMPPRIPFQSPIVYNQPPRPKSIPSTSTVTSGSPVTSSTDPSKASTKSKITHDHR